MEKHRNRAANSFSNAQSNVDAFLAPGNKYRGTDFDNQSNGVIREMTGETNSE